MTGKQVARAVQKVRYRKQRPLPWREIWRKLDAWFDEAALGEVEDSSWPAQKKKIRQLVEEARNGR